MKWTGLFNNTAATKTLTARFLPGFFLFAFAFLLYMNTIPHDYALDDVAVIQQNKFTKMGLAGIPQLLKTFYWQGYWDLNSGLYRPLSMISFAVEKQIFGERPHLSHLINVLLFAFTSLLLFRVLIKLTPGQNHFFSFLTVLLFISHPVHSEVIANIKSRDELLCLFFLLFSLLFIFNFISTGSIRNLILAAVLFFLSLLSKEGALVLAGLLPLMLYFLTPADNRQIVRTTLILVIPALIFLFIHYYVISHGPARITYSYHDNSLVASPDPEGRIATAIGTNLQYLKLLVFPFTLSYDYSYNQFPNCHFSDYNVLLSLFLHLGLLAYAVYFLKKKTFISFCIFFYFISISMVSNVFMLIGTTFAERLLYLPSIGFCMALSWIVLQLHQTGQGKGKPVALLLGLAVIASYSFRTFTRNKDWKNNFTLFEQDVKSAPGSSRTHYNYGTELMFRKAFPETDTLKKKLLLDVVISQLEAAAHIDSIDPGIYLNLSTAYYQQKNYRKAIEKSKLAVYYNPADGKAYSTLGNSYYRTGQFDLAIENLKTSIAKGFGEQEAWNTIGVSYFGKKDYEKA